MPNMSYCRFENTARDLRDCLDAIRNGKIDELNSYEIQGLKNILDDAKSIVSMREELEEIINDHEN